MKNTLLEKMNDVALAFRMKKNVILDRAQGGQRSGDFYSDAIGVNYSIKCVLLYKRKDELVM